jgi:NADH-quinone oxidoreductase subunit M
MITALILIPLLGALVVGVAPRALSRSLSMVVCGLAALTALTMVVRFETTQSGLQFLECADWIPKVGAEFLVGVDGLGVLMVLLTTLLFPFALLAGKVADRGYCALMLVMQGALYGTFTAHNFVLWFLFYEMSLIPAFLLIKMWGGGKRDAAATKFFLYTFLGGVAMLVAVLGVYFVTDGERSFDFREFAKIGASGAVTGTLGWMMFAGVFIGLAVKVPVFPFHTWLPDAYTSAPTGVSMVLTGALSKMGVYGAIRILLPLFPGQIQALQPHLLTLIVASIVFSSLAAFVQRDIKRMIAYISINHLGYCMLGLVAVAGTAGAAAADSEAALGGVFAQVFNHGITAAALFYFAGLLEERQGTRQLGDFGGLMQCQPQFCALMSVAMFSSLGLPGLNGFIGEILIFKGSFGLVPVATAFAAIGLLITAAVFLRAMQKLFSGPLAASCENFPVLTTTEKIGVIPATLIMIFIGVYPQPVFQLFNATVAGMAKLFS